jgi:hypothetical protein
MNKKPVIKILKRDERRRDSAAKSSGRKNAPADPTQKVVETVSGWVREFREKSNGEASSLFTTLFEKTPRANEA